MDYIFKMTMLFVCGLRGVVVKKFDKFSEKVLVRRNLEKKFENLKKIFFFLLRKKKLFEVN